MIRKAQKTSEKSAQKNWWKFLIHQPLLLKVVTWLGSISLIATANIAGAEIQPLKITPTAVTAKSLRPVALPAVSPLPSTAKFKASAAQRQLHTDGLTANNFTVGVQGAQAKPVRRYQSQAGVPLAITVPATVDCKRTTSQLVSNLCSQVRPQNKTVVNVRPSIIPARITPQLQPLPIVRSNPAAVSSTPAITRSTVGNSRPTPITFQKPQPLAQQSVPGNAVAIYVAPPQSNVVPTNQVKPVSRIPTVSKPVVPGLQPIPAVKVATASPAMVLPNYGVASDFVYPLASPAPMTSSFGWRVHPITGNRRFHAGLDLGAPSGAPIVAAANGRVVVAGWHGGYGKAVVIEHNGRLQTLYGHMSELFVQEGQEVRQGTVIGRVGSTGNSTGPHLHFETHAPTNDGWVAVDPDQVVQYALNNLRQSIQSSLQEKVVANQL
jgi:murein DD-endopeptidase MepM/ murein hydrolase activator NlpD